MKATLKIILLIFSMSCLLALAKTDVFAEKDEACVSNCRSPFLTCDKGCESAKSSCYGQCSNLHKALEDITKCQSSCDSNFNSCSEGCLIDYSACFKKCEG